MITSAIILGSVISVYLTGGLFVKKDGATAPALTIAKLKSDASSVLKDFHYIWPHTLFQNLKKAL